MSYQTPGNFKFLNNQNQQNYYDNQSEKRVPQGGGIPWSSQVSPNNASQMNFNMNGNNNHRSPPKNHGNSNKQVNINNLKMTLSGL